MRKVLIAVLLLICLGSIGAYIYFSFLRGQGISDRPAQYNAGEEFTLQFTMPLGTLVEYDANIERRTTVSTNEGKVVFTVNVEMDQVHFNHKELAKTYKLFYLDIFRDISVIEAKVNDKPLDSDKRANQLSAETRDFKYGAYIYNDFEMKPDGLPAVAGKVESESALVNAQLEYIQYFPGDKHKVGDKWDFKRKIGKYEVEYKFEFKDLVFRHNMKCAKLLGSCTIQDTLENIEISPTEFTIWFAIDEGIIAASQIMQKFRSESKGTWYVREMSLRKEYVSHKSLDPTQTVMIDSYAQKIIDMEREIRNDKRDRTKDPERRIFLEKVIAEFGETMPFTKGALFLLDMMK